MKEREGVKDILKERGDEIRFEGVEGRLDEGFVEDGLGVCMLREDEILEGLDK